jgi:hypothetical protein
MKTIRLISYLILILVFQQTYSQQAEITLSKSKRADLCERIIFFDNIWFDQGVIKADISILSNPRSKPITGGYKERDQIFINDGCTYYLNEIDTNGFSENGGTIKISEDDYVKIIRKVKLQRKMNEEPYDEKISLLKVYFKTKVEAARPVIKYFIDGRRTFLVYDVVRTFDNEEEALNYAKEKGITDINTN